MSADFDDHTPPGYKIRQLEARADATDERLSKGGEQFQAQRSKLAWFLAGFIVTILAAALAIGRVLQRVDDTAATQEEHEETLNSVREDVAAGKVEQVRLRGAVERVEEGQDRLELKLDRALDQRRRTR